MDNQLKEGAKLIQQKRSMPILLGNAVKNEIEKTRAHRKSQKQKQKPFCEPSVSTIKNKFVKIHLDSRACNETTIKRKAQMRNVGELTSIFSRKLTDGPEDEVWISTFDLGYAYGQLQLLKRAMNQCIFTANF